MTMTYVWTLVSQYLEPLEVIDLSNVCKASSHVAKTYNRQPCKKLLTKHASSSYSIRVTLYHLGLAIKRKCTICWKKFTGKFDTQFNVYGHSNCIRKAVYNEYYLNDLTTLRKWHSFAKDVGIPYAVFEGYNTTFRDGTYSYYVFWRYDDGNIPPWYTIEWSLQHNPEIAPHAREDLIHKEIENGNAARRIANARRVEGERLLRAEVSKKRERGEAMQDPTKRKKLRLDEAASALEKRRQTFIGLYGVETLKILETQGRCDLLGDYLSPKKAPKMTQKAMKELFPDSFALKIEAGHPETMVDYVITRLKSKIGCNCKEHIVCGQCRNNMIRKGWIKLPPPKLLISKKTAKKKLPNPRSSVAKPVIETTKALTKPEQQLLLYKKYYAQWKVNQKIDLEAFQCKTKNIDFDGPYNTFQGVKLSMEFRQGVHGLGYYRTSNLFQCERCKAHLVEPAFTSGHKANICKGCDISRFTLYMDNNCDPGLASMEYILMGLLRYELSAGSLAAINKRNCLSGYCHKCLTNPKPENGQMCEACICKFREFSKCSNIDSQIVTTIGSSSSSVLSAHEGSQVTSTSSNGVIREQAQASKEDQSTKSSSGISEQVLDLKDMVEKENLSPVFVSQKNEPSKCEQKIKDQSTKPSSEMELPTTKSSSLSASTKQQNTTKNEIKLPVRRSSRLQEQRKG